MNWRTRGLSLILRIPDGGMRSSGGFAVWCAAEIIDDLKGHNGDGRLKNLMGRRSADLPSVHICLWAKDSFPYSVQTHNVVKE